MDASCLCQHCFLKDNPYPWVEHINMLSLHQIKKLSLSRYLTQKRQFHWENVLQFLPVSSNDFKVMSSLDLQSGQCWTLKLGPANAYNYTQLDHQTWAKQFNWLNYGYIFLQTIELSKEHWNLREQHISIQEHTFIASRNPFSTHFSSFLYLTL